jgi:hypothetical protein
VQQEQLTISSAKTARLFENRARVRLLEPFIQEPQTLSDAATQLGIKVPRLHYHATKFLEHGLLEATGTTKRNGRTVKVYRTTARAFFIPFELTSSETLETFITDMTSLSNATQVRASVQSMERLAPDWGFRWTSNGAGGLYFEMLPKTMSKEALETLIFAEDTPAQLSFHVAYTLEHGAAKALQKELRDLAERYFAAQVPGAGRYVFSISLAPAPTE